MYGHFTAFPLVGHSVADSVIGPDDRAVTAPAAARFGLRAPAPAIVATDLERFWPSRRGHAFDELCLPAAR